MLELSRGRPSQPGTGGQPRLDSQSTATQKFLTRERAHFSFSVDNRARSTLGGSAREIAGTQGKQLCRLTPDQSCSLVLNQFICSSGGGDF